MNIALAMLVWITAFAVQNTSGGVVKRCANLFDESCNNNGIIGGGSDEEWIKNPGNTPGKRNALYNVPYYYGSRCANLFDEGCINDGVIAGGRDEEWITNPGNTPGKRNVHYSVQGLDLRTIAELMQRLRGVVTKRCANLFDEGCANGGIPGAGNDDDWLNGGQTPGRR